jgi:hypothetical protein
MVQYSEIGPIVSTHQMGIVERSAGPGSVDGRYQPGVGVKEVRLGHEEREGRGPRNVGQARRPERVIPRVRWYLRRVLELVTAQRIPARTQRRTGIGRGEGGWSDDLCLR